MLDLGRIKIHCLETPLYFEHAFCDAGNILSALERILERGQEPYQEKITSRLFIAGGTRDDLSELVLHSPKPHFLATETWLESITGDETFCLTLNGVNALDDEIDSYVRQAFNVRWLEQIGLPMGGIDAYCFMGKYPITPFGIHTDREHTFLYHLGPGTKKAWLWSSELFEKIRGPVKNRFIMEDVENLAEKFTLQPGDFLFIPAGYYHVLANPEFSMTLGIAPYDFTLRMLLHKAVANGIRLKDGTEPNIDLNTPLSPSRNSDEALLIPARNIDLASTVNGSITYLRNEFKRLISCQGMKFSPLPTAAHLKVNSNIERLDYIIETEESQLSEHTIVFVRGNIFSIPKEFTPYFFDFLESLPSGRKRLLSEILSGEDMVDEFILHVIQTFARYRVLRVTVTDVQAG